MIKYTFEKVDEHVFFEKLQNGVDVYLYKTNKTKNFYVTISVKYGAKINKYKLNNKEVDIIPGSAHFLEHKVMALSENPEISKRINDLGSLANAWTDYHGTNYNIFGSINLKENIKLLLDIFYNIDINDKCVEEEKGIIAEEIDMYKDNIDNLLHTKLLSNMFHNSYTKNTIIGEQDDIFKITSSHLNQIYNDYYKTNNTFIVVCGDFDENEIIDYIKEYMVNIKPSKKELPKRIHSKDKETVKVAYEEIQKSSNIDRVKIGFKMPKKIFGKIDNETLLAYINLILSMNASQTSPLLEEYKNKDIIHSLSSRAFMVDEYLIIFLSAVCKDANIFINKIKEDIKKLTISEKEFERKRKLMLKNYILQFDNIEDVEWIISTDLMMYDKVNYKDYSCIMNLDYEELTRILKLLDFNNMSIIRTIK